jgi:hypothetical protein
MCYINKNCVTKNRKKLFDLFPRTGHAKRTVPDAFDGGQHVGKPLHLPGSSLDGNDFQAVVMIQVDVLRRNDQFLKIMLDIREFVQQVPLVMIEDEGDGAGYLPVLLPFFPDKFLADHVAERFGAA